MKRWMWLMAVALGACGPTVVSVSPRGDAGRDDAPEPPDAAAPEDVAPDRVATELAAPERAVPEGPLCLTTGAMCRGRALGCCTGFCDYQPYGYSNGSGRCVRFVGEGEYCEESRRCASGRCVDEICRATSCAATDARCWGDAQCCAGFCTASAMSYAGGRCALAQPAGASCDGARWCQSGRCVDGACAR
jgi:hypothetical protein